jgi:hypothetical protein
MISSNLKLADVFEQEMPQIVYKRGKTLGNLLVSSKFTEQWNTLDLENIKILQTLIESNQTITIESVTPCGSFNCKCCIHIIKTNSYMDSNRELCFDIMDQFDCNSSDVVYIISCLKCNMLYVGQSGRKVRERLNNHRSDIKNNKNTAVSLHFNSPNHSITDLRITPIITLKELSFEKRGKLELQLMKTLGTIYPSGMNHYPLIKNT